MMEALAHNQLKHLLEEFQTPWSHHLTFSRLVARSLRRKDNTVIELNSDFQDIWWLGLLVPLCLETNGSVLLLSKRQKTRFLRQELPRLRSQGLTMACWEGDKPPQGNQLWLLNLKNFIKAYYRGSLKSRQLIIPEAELLTKRLRDEMTIIISPSDWELLRLAHPSIDSEIIHFYQQMSNKLFTDRAVISDNIGIDSCDISCLQNLISSLGDLPKPWSYLLDLQLNSWACWAEIDRKMFSWNLVLKPFEPLGILSKLLNQQPTLIIANSGKNFLFHSELKTGGFIPDVKVNLNEPNLDEPILVFAPYRQPLPNTERFEDHLYQQACRLVLGRAGLTIILVDDKQMRFKLTARLAAEFGKRVVQETTAPEVNGVVCASWNWWLNFQDQMPLPEQLIIGLLPLSSLDSPFTAARVERMKQRGQDWFRELLLPESLGLLVPAIAPLRKNGGRLAILDGRVRRRSWGLQILEALEPWTYLNRLLP